LKRLGKALHLSSNKNLILRTKIKVIPQTVVVDNCLNPVGKTYDVFGPVANPYLSIKPSVKNPEKYVGHVLYVMD